jgi:aldehyde:ferredoxin oxidoreductase
VLQNGAVMDPRVTEGKAGLDILFQNLTAALDSSGACLFATFGIGGAELAEMLSALTGVEYSLDEFLKIGERIWNQERLWNLKQGYTTADDTLPVRLLTEPIKTGSAAGQVNHLGEMLPEYYQLRGWDEVGVPSKAKLKELALS